MSKFDLSKILDPKSIVVFGSSRAAHVIRECKRIGFNGSIYAIHPKRDEIEGIKCFRNLSELPETPDVAYIAVNADAAIDITADLKEMGCGGVVLHASGFSEVGPIGEEKQARLVEVAGDMPIIGPNCYGIINALDHVALWPDQHGCKPLDKGVAIITQSGNIAINLTMQRRGVPIAYMFTLGNQASISIAEAMEAVLKDDRVTAIGLHIEAIRDIAQFESVARIAHDKKVPIVAIKTGRSAVAAKIALSHTSSLSGSDKLFDALFERLGIARVDTVDGLLESLKLLSAIGPMTGNKIASMSCSGGEAGMMADLVEKFDLYFPEMDDAHKARVYDTLGDYASVSNPLDYHTYIWGDVDAKTKTFSAMMSGQYDATMLLLDWPNYDGADPSEWDAAMNGLINASKNTGQNGILLSSMAECLPEHAIEACMENGVAPMIGLESCLQALGCAYWIGNKQGTELPEPIQVSTSSVGDGVLLDEWRSKKMLQQFGLNIPQSALVTSATEAVAAAEAIGYPVVIKAVGSHLAHKTEMGAVKLNLKDADSVFSAVEALENLSDRYLVEEMVPGSIAEII
ncbi:MAG: acetate--CoA ligase family protein, partial [Alphaproteobacteria bacterium]|nr:acetate--CoA ligase family protein [Alphaproteobacteria bacterium]